LLRFATRTSAVGSASKEAIAILHAFADTDVVISAEETME
jgi:hypothetical protein